MIITVQGTREGNHDSARLLAALSFFGIKKEKKRTLVLQMVNRTTESVENYLIGKSLRNESLIQDELLPDISIGMDALCIHGNGAFSAEIFDECTRHLAVSNSKNLYDTAIVSRKDSFEQELLAREKKVKAEDEGAGYLEALLTAAGRVYDLVFCLLPSENQGLCEAVLPYADVNLICIRQRQKEAVNAAPGKNLYVATDYESGSVFHGKALAKAYHVKTVYGLMHNIAFHDACENGVLLDFMQKNINCSVSDSNYHLIHNLDLLYRAVTETEAKEEPDLPKKIVYDPDDWAWELRPVSEEINLETTETGFFRKKRQRRLVLEKQAAEPQAKDETLPENAEKPEKRSGFFQKKNKKKEKQDATAAQGLPDSDSFKNPDADEPPEEASR